MAGATPGSQDNPGTSCKAILAANPATQSGVYWLKPGANDLMIFDEHGASPSRVRILTDAKGGAFDR